jgi:hypothetical protein
MEGLGDLVLIPESPMCVVVVVSCGSWDLRVGFRI